MIPSMYRTAARFFEVIPLPPGKVARARRGWREAAARWVEWARIHRQDGPLVWAHAASVGEIQVVEPVARRMAAAVPNLQAVLTYSSPSASGWPTPTPFARSDFQPADGAPTLTPVFDTLRPHLLLVSRGDLWPGMVDTARARGIPIAVVGALLRPGSARLRWPVRTLLRETVEAVSWLGAVDRQAAGNWARAGVPEGRITVTGDPRHDHILERRPDPHILAPIRQWAQGDRIVVAGSTHPTDMPPLLAALAEARHGRPDLRMLVVPHDPGGDAEREVRSEAGRHGLTASGLDDPTRPDVGILDGTGVLFPAYASATVAYVGGGFDGRTVHSVAEPAAFGLPILTGPGGATDPTAGPFRASGGTLVLPRAGAKDVLVRALIQWLSDPDLAAEAGLANRAALQSGAAAASATAALRLMNLPA